MGTLFLKEISINQSLLSLYRRLHKLPGFILLQSTDKQRGRYDIVSARPYQQLSLSVSDECWQEKLIEFEAMIPESDSAFDLPFQGGVMGYLSYELGVKLADVKSKQHALTPVPMLQLGLYDWALIYDHQLAKASLFAAMRDDKTRDCIDEVLSLMNEEDEAAEDLEFLSSFQPMITKEEYQRCFDSIQQDLRKGRCYQVNYTQPFKADIRGDSWTFYEHMAARNPVPFAAYLKGETENILSFSPERFLYINNKEMLASPIKGTASRDNEPANDEANKLKLQNCLKNRAENVMIVDLMRNDLGKIAETGSIEVSALFDVQSFNGVHHLVSDVRGRLKDNISLFEALLSCFPAGSITGAPKREAMQAIAELEPYSRGVYCGSIGYLSAHGRMDFNVAIRTVTDVNQTLYLPAGGGIVLDSDADSEYGECLTKISAITDGH